MTPTYQQIDHRLVSWDTPCSGIAGLNERVIELPLAVTVAGLDRPGWVLDAGCTLNSITNLIPKGRQPIAHLVHLTQALETEAYQPRGTQISYVTADLRDLRIFATNAFDRTICVSTLEHVGLDNSSYGARVETDPGSWTRAFDELLRVTKDELLITVPYAEVGTTNERWRYFTSNDMALMHFHVEPHRSIAMRFYARVDGTWGGGGAQPMMPDLAGFPDKVNQIVCLKITR